MSIFIVYTMNTTTILIMILLITTLHKTLLITLNVGDITYSDFTYNDNAYST